MLTLYFLLSLIGSVAYHVNGIGKIGATDSEMSSSDKTVDRQDKVNDMMLPWYLKLVWLSQNTAFNSGLAVTLCYWAIDADNINVFNIHMHGVNVLLIFMDLGLIASPIRVLHVIYPVVFVLIYTLFSFICYKFMGINPTDSYLRALVDWGVNPGLAIGVFTCAAFITIPLCHVFIYGVYKLRKFIARRSSQFYALRDIYIV
ncbi:protein rolling stone-like [Saccoglossus kowalevskii]|uniref:Uncharacterized protein LOC102806885 n=1 Tax=Saccoglossus kowalevskii TaxID=10224 RepID=A0ABM0LYU5_SACKO|nr:PREDICTED: uncharacterized protein LOC102806885 [Saccoglossus kowalevskii]